MVLLRLLIGSVDLQKLEEAATTGAPVDNLGQILLIAALLLAVAILSIVDAVRGAKRTS